MRCRSRLHGPLELEEQLGEGGEAAVFAVRSLERLAAKIYHPANRTQERAAKTAAMVRIPPLEDASGNKVVRLAWPVDLLYEDAPAESFLGFLMPRIDTGKTCKLFSIYHPNRRPPGYTWEHLLVVALNLAAVVGEVHRAGHVVGDLNDENVLVWLHSCQLTMVDCDSFQITDPWSQATYRSEVGINEYAPLEILTRDHFASVNRTPATDNFSLAILIYKLLVEGQHPFSGPPGPSVEDNLRGGNHRLAVTEAPGRHPATILPPALMEHFGRCFGPGHRHPHERPSAANWYSVLDQARRRLSRCERSAEHRFSNHLRHCPFCVAGRTASVTMPPRPAAPAAAASAAPATPAVPAAPVAPPARRPHWSNVFLPPWTVHRPQPLTRSWVVARALLHGALIAGWLGLTRWQPSSRAGSYDPERVFGAVFDSFNFLLADQLGGLLLGVALLLVVGPLWQQIEKLG